MSGGEVALYVLATVLSLATTAALVLKGPLGKALGRRLAGDDDLSERIERLEARLEETAQRLAHAERRLAPPVPSTPRHDG